MVEPLPLAQVRIPGSQDQVLHQAPCKELASPSACVSLPLSLYLSRIKKKKILRKNQNITAQSIMVGRISDKHRSVLYLPNLPGEGIAYLPEDSW